MTGDDEDATSAGDQSPGPSRLRAVHGPVEGHEPPPAVRLCREWKGLVVADLLRDELVARLPGQVRSALHHLERGDWRAAEQALPGELPPVLAGPRGVHGSRRVATAVVAIAAVLAAVAAAAWMGA